MSLVVEQEENAGGDSIGAVGRLSPRMRTDDSERGRHVFEPTEFPLLKSALRRREANGAVCIQRHRVARHSQKSNGWGESERWEGESAEKRCVSRRGKETAPGVEMAAKQRKVEETDGKKQIFNEITQRPGANASALSLPVDTRKRALRADRFVRKNLHV